MLTKEQKQAYIESPSKCPYCASENISAGSRNFDDNFCSVDVACVECGKEWTDIYKLIDIEEV